VWARVTSHLVLVVAIFLPRRGGRASFAPAIRSSNSICLHDPCWSRPSCFFGAGEVRGAWPKAIANPPFVAPLAVVFLAWPAPGRAHHPRDAPGFPSPWGFAGVLVVIRPGSSVFQWASLMIVRQRGCLLPSTRSSFAAWPAADHPSTTVFYTSARQHDRDVGARAPSTGRRRTTGGDMALLCSPSASFGGFRHYCVGTRHDIRAGPI